MKIVKKIAIRILLLSIILVVSNAIYTNFFFENDVQKYSKIINLVRDIPKDTRVLYMGESSNITFREDDMDKRPISGFLSDYFPKLKVYGLTKPAAHAGIYKVLLKNIPKDANIKTLIITLNLRSFNAQWIYSDLETSLQKSMVLLKDNPPLLNRFLLSFKAYDIKTKAERSQEIEEKWTKDAFHLPYNFPYKNVITWDGAMYKKGIKNSDGSKNQALTELACHYIKGYAFQIDTLTNPRIKDFDEIVELAKKRGWNLVFNLMAENYQKGDELLGDELLYFLKENRKLLIDYYQRRGVAVVDNLFSIDNNQFIDTNWTTEHYAEIGRKIIAANVAEKLKEFYPDFYVDADYKHATQSKFYNNCEGNLVWGQMQTLTDEKAFEGQKSSKTGNGNDYSLTFEYPFQGIPDSLKNNIHINCKLFQTAINHDAKLVIQATGDKIDNFWRGYNIKNQNTTLNSWEDFSLDIQIPKELIDADLIKIYLFNPSETTIYMDDIHIEFE